MKTQFCFLLLLFLLTRLQAQDNRVKPICATCEGAGSAGASVSCTGILSTIYVDQSRATDGTGKSWSSAKKTLQGALAIANRCSTVSTIKVAKGTYRASTSVNTTARDYNFFIGDPYTILGGYPGGAGPDSSVRDFVNNATIIDAEIQDLYESYHAISIYAVAGDISIDGFQIKNGFADGSGSVELEPGINMARNVGAAFYIREANNVFIRNCAIYSNVASSRGGAIFAYNSNVTLQNCVLVNNTSGTDGGAIYAQSISEINITNCTLYNNLNLGGNDAVYATTGSTINSSNTIIWGNTDALAGGSTKNVSYCLFKNGNMNNNGIVDDPQFRNAANPVGVDNKWFTADDGLALEICSPAINRGTNIFPTSLQNDITRNDRPFNVQADIGAYEKQSVATVSSTSSRSIHLDSTNTYFYDGITALTAKDECRIIARLQPFGNSASAGRIKAKTFIETRNLKFGTLPLVSRHYHLDDSQAAQHMSNIITLYFSNGEFNNYNLRPEVTIKLPVTTDLNPEANVRIVRFKGSSSTGLPDSYGTVPEVIKPVDLTVQWSAVSLTWKVEFRFHDGLGGFFISTAKNYEFIGNGNWDISSNWLNNEMPPAVLPSYHKIFIKNGSNCILNIFQTLKKDAELKVENGAAFTITNALLVEDDMNRLPPIVQ